MGKINKDNLGYLGDEFQVRLIAQLLSDNNFGESIVEIIDAGYFDDEHLKIIMSTIKDTYNQHSIIPDIGSLEFRLLNTVTSEFDQKFALAKLQLIKDANLNDSLGVQELGMSFCKQQELKKSIKVINQIIESGNVLRYNECEEILKKALDYGHQRDNGVDVLDNIDSVLSDDFRKPIPTGIGGLDEVMNGGLSGGELAIILAAFGVGKTTMITKIANTAKNLGYNVLQIFFEDTEKVIQRKHLACWSGYELNSLSLHKQELVNLIETKSKERGCLRLKRFPSYGTTIPIIKQYIKKQIASGFSPDLILIDYIDCIDPSRVVENVNIGEGQVMRELETFISEFNIACWVATQGNRSSIKSDVVESDQMGGSIKKGQIGHFLVSIAKSLDQKENGTANMAILKSRFGKDGIIYNDIEFNNATIQINMDSENIGRSRSETKVLKEADTSKYIADRLAVIQARKNLINNDSN